MEFNQNKKICKLLKNGELICLPTDTVMGLICDATNENAIAKIYETKERSQNKPLAIFVSDIKMAEQYVILSEQERALLQRYTPGGITLICQRKPDCNLADNLNVVDDSIGIRIPDDENILNIVAEFGNAIAATSANKSGEDFREGCLGDEVNYFFVDKREQLLASTVIDARDGNIKILRQGEVKIEKY